MDGTPMTTITEPTAPATGALGFFEVRVADPAKGHAFFGGLFGWQFVDGNVPGYAMIPNAEPGAGLTGTDEGSGIHTYFTVPDIEAATTRVRELGGEASTPVQIPSGTFTRCRDDQGTEFSLWQELTG